MKHHRALGGSRDMRVRHVKYRRALVIGKAMGGKKKKAATGNKRTTMHAHHCRGRGKGSTTELARIWGLQWQQQKPNQHGTLSHDLADKMGRPREPDSKGGDDDTKAPTKAQMNTALHHRLPPRYHLHFNHGTFAATRSNTTFTIDYLLAFTSTSTEPSQP